MGPLAVAGITAGINTAGSIVGGLFGQSQSKKAWREQAEYNSPVNQMKRLKAAGLNPNLVYGNGSVANTQNNSYDTIKPDTSKIGSEGLQNYVALRSQQMQNDLLEKQMEFIDAQIRDKNSTIAFRDGAQTNKTLGDLNYTNLSHEQKRQIMGEFQKNTSLDQELKRKQIDSVSTNTEMVKMQLLSYPREVQAKLSETYKRIEKMGFEIDNIKANTSLLRDEKAMKFLRIEEQRLFNELRKEGINPNDNFLWRQLRQLGQWFDNKTNTNTW